MKNGGKRPPGRPKGSKNRVVQLAVSAREACYRRKLDPFLALADIAKDKEHPDFLRANAELAKYLQPVLKAVEHSGTVDGTPVSINLDFGIKERPKDITPPRDLIEPPVEDVIEVDDVSELPPAGDGFTWEEVKDDEVPAEA